jgi:hypothetical protein
VAKIESESMHEFYTLIPFFLFAKEKPVFPVLIPLRQRIALRFHAPHDGIARWMKPRFISLLLETIADLAKGKSELLVENALLWHQLIFLRRQVKRPACRKTDRFLLLRAARGCLGPGSRHSSWCNPPPFHQSSVGIISSRFRS